MLTRSPVIATWSGASVAQVLHQRVEHLAAVHPVAAPLPGQVAQHPLVHQRARADPRHRPQMQVREMGEAEARPVRWHAPVPAGAAPVRRASGQTGCAASVSRSRTRATTRGRSSSGRGAATGVSAPSRTTRPARLQRAVERVQVARPVDAGRAWSASRRTGRARAAAAACRDRSRRRAATARRATSGRTTGRSSYQRGRSNRATGRPVRAPRPASRHRRR